jgi:hypothetical protein
MIAVGAVAALLVVSSNLVDEGEIVEVKTVDSAGREHVTELWIVDLPAGPFLRASSPDAQWLARVRAEPEVVVTRRGQQVAYRAIPEADGEIRQHVNAAMREKYGVNDRFWSRVSDTERMVPIRLLPSASASASTRTSH